MTAVATVSKAFTFHAAHQLPNHDGKCRDLHGHTYRVEVGVTGPVNARDGSPDEGMVLDFGVIKAAWAPLHQLVDHKFLNDVLPSEFQPTTAENIAGWVLSELLEAVPQVTVVRVWETPTSCVEVTA